MTGSKEISPRGRTREVRVRSLTTALEAVLLAQVGSRQQEPGPERAKDAWSI
jgi:hypothetical protein